MTPGLRRRRARIALLRPNTVLEPEHAGSKEVELIDRTLGHYRITAAIGAGGMGEVYRATDTKLGRDVALKVLPSEMAADPERLDRFQREARALAALDHPGIVSVFSVEESDGVHFLTMQLVEGESLDHLIPEGGFPLDQLLEIAVPLSDALAAAHEKSIVHRDLKPANVMVPDRGRVKVLDFGLAKLAAPKTGEPLHSQLPTEMHTREGVVMGTVPYMSPEQLSGKTADPRTDVFSLGIILYEMASGRRPFHGNSSAELISSILRDTPRPLAELRADLPRELARIIQRCLEKDPGRRYPTARTLHGDLHGLQSDPAERSQTSGSLPVSGGQAIPTGRRRLPWLVAAVVVALVASFAFLWNRRQPHAVEAPAAAARTSTPSIAVLPFVNESGSPDDEYFSDGMTDELASGLMKVTGLRVAARSSAFTFKGKAADAREVGTKLNVGTVLEGTVRRSGSKLRVTVQLVNAPDGLVVWSERYERDAKDVFAVQDDITGSIVAALRLKLGSSATAGSKAEQTENAEAHDLYLRGRFFMFKQTEDGLRKSLKYFEQALAKDRNYAPAYAGMAFAWTWLADVYLPPREAEPKAKAAALRALELDPDNVEARSMLATVLYVYDWDTKAAEEEHRRALQSNPNSMDAHNLYALTLCASKRFDAGLAEADRAIALDPLNAWPSWTREMCLCLARRYDEAIEQHRKTAELDPNFFYLDAWAGVAYREKNMYAEAVAEYQSAEKASNGPIAGLAVTYARMGKTSEARIILQELLAVTKQRYVAPEVVATIYASLGEKDQAFAWLEKSYEARSGSLTWSPAFPAFDPLRSDPRFAELLRKMGLEK
ncbi:MAG: protein kinase [Acidobacteriota bacterium]